MTNSNDAAIIFLVLLGFGAWWLFSWLFRSTGQWAKPQADVDPQADRVPTCFDCIHFESHSEWHESNPPAISFSCACNAGYFKLIGWDTTDLWQCTLIRAETCPGFQASERM